MRPVRMRLLGSGCLLVLAATIAPACGGDSGGPSKTAVATPAAAADEAYVAGLCKAASQLSSEVEKALAGPTPADFGKALTQLLAALGQPVQRFSESFAQLTPPPDLATWQKDTAQKLATAARALQDKRYDDPSLAGLSKSPIPDMPEAARRRLSAIADKNDDCRTANPFTSAFAGAGGGSGAPTASLRDAATGTWKGRLGTLQFNADGTARFEIKNCGTVRPSSDPFGVVSNCPATVWSGKLEVGANQYSIQAAGGAATTFQAYVDGQKRLHVGVGSVSPFGPGQKGSVTLFSGATLTVDGGSCTKQPFAGKGATSIACAWKKEEGQDVLEYDNDFSGKDELVILSAEGLAVSPEIFVGAYDR